MHLDVQDLRNFYYRNTLGRAAQASLRGAVSGFWPEAKGQTVVGFGFAVPLLRPYLDQSRRTVALMPGPQGVMPWPANLPNVSVLCEDTQWPIETGHVDKLIVMHGLETSEQPSGVLEEAWRVLGPGGRMIVIVPNRAGLWTRRDATPFGYGRPYSVRQLETQLHKHQFLPERHKGALYQFPTHRRMGRSLGRLFEQMGRRMPAVIAGGVFVLEASKLVYPPKGRLRPVERRKQALPQGVSAPVVGNVVGNVAGNVAGIVAGTGADAGTPATGRGAGHLHDF